MKPLLPKINYAMSQAVPLILKGMANNSGLRHFSSPSSLFPEITIKIHVGLIIAILEFELASHYPIEVTYFKLTCLIRTQVWLSLESTAERQPAHSDF